MTRLTTTFAVSTIALMAIAMTADHAVRILAICVALIGGALISIIDGMTMDRGQTGSAVA